MIGLNPANWFVGLGAEQAVFYLSMLPITELRASIPIGIEVYGLAPLRVWSLAVFGNMVPTVFILLLMPVLHDWLIKKSPFGGVVRDRLKRAEVAFQGRYAKYGAIALVLFVGMPLPFTGAWTGSLAAFIFRIPFHKSLPLIFLGVCLAASIVTFVTLFAGGALRWIF